jgi:hypothetical protein
MKMKRTLGRREFVKKAAQAAAMMVVVGGMTPSTGRAETPGQSLGTIPTRTLGKTGLKLPILGYGGAGHIRVTVTANKVTVDYVRSYLPGDEQGAVKNGAIGCSYTVLAGKGGKGPK